MVNYDLLFFQLQLQPLQSKIRGQSCIVIQNAALHLNPPTANTHIIMNNTPIQPEMMALARAMGRLILAKNSQSVREIEVTLSLVQRFPNYFEMLLKLLRIRDFTQEIKKLATAMINNFVKDHLKDDDQDLGSYSRKLVASLKDPEIEFSLKSIIAVALANIIKKDEKRQYFQMLLSALKSHLESEIETVNMDLCIVLGRTIIQSSLLKVQEVAPILDKYIEMTLQAKQCLRKKVETFDVASLCQISERVVQLISLLINIFDQNYNDELGNTFRLGTIMRIVPVSQHARIVFSRDLTQNNRIHENLSHLKSASYNLLSIIIKKCSNAASGDVGDVNRKISNIIQEIMSGLSGLFIYQSQYSQGIVMEHILQSQLNILCHIYTSPQLSKLLLNHDLTILKIISRILEYSHHEILVFISQPVDFNNHIIEIIDAKPKEGEQSEESPLLEGVSFKVRAAQLLVQIGIARPQLCYKVLEELVLSLVKFTREGRECINPLLMLNILCKFANSNQIAVIGAALEMSLRMVPPSTFHGNERACLQYALNLITLSTFIREVNRHEAHILQNLLILGVELMSDPSYLQVYQILGCELVESLYELTTTHIWLVKEGIAMMVQKLKMKMRTRSVTKYLLDGIFHFIHNGSFTMEYCFVLEETMRTTAVCIENEVVYEDYKKIIVNKSWNILRDTIERYLPLNRPNRLLEQIFMPLIEYYTETLKGDYQEDCFLLMAMLIQSRKAVSNFTLEIYRIIILVFYKQYQGRFGLSFHPLQLLIYYGKATLTLKKDMLRQIKQMCLYSISLQNQDNACEGVLILHSLVMTLKEQIDGLSYHQILEQIQKRYLRKKPNRTLYTALAGLQGLCFAFSNSLWTSPQSLTSTIKQMLEQSRQTCDEYFLRVIFISICEIVLKVSFNQLTFYAEECVELFKISFRLLDRRVETRHNHRSDITGLKNDTVNMAKELNVMAYLKAFLRKLQKVHERIFEQVMEATEWKYRLKEYMDVEIIMIE